MALNTKVKTNMYPPGFIKVNVDMDGVLTDWDGAVKELTGEILDLNDPKDKKDRVYKAIDAAGPRFWSDMKWLPDSVGGKALWTILKPFSPILLSSPGQFLYAEQGKKEWVSKNMPGTVLFLDPDKFKYAERDSVLIDDMEKNISAWQGSGGIGILHKNTESTEIALLSLLSPERND